MGGSDNIVLLKSLNINNIVKTIYLFVILHSLHSRYIENDHPQEIYSSMFIKWSHSDHVLFDNCHKIYDLDTIVLLSFKQTNYQNSPMIRILRNICISVIMVSPANNTRSFDIQSIDPFQNRIYLNYFHQIRRKQLVAFFLFLSIYTSSSSVPYSYNTRLVNIPTHIIIFVCSISLIGRSVVYASSSSCWSWLSVFHFTKINCQFLLNCRLLICFDLNSLKNTFRFHLLSMYIYMLIVRSSIQSRINY